MKEKEFLDQLENRAELTRFRILLEQYVSPDIARLLADGSEQFPEHGSIKDLVVLFADIANFTRLVQRIELDILAEFLKDFFKLFTTLVYRNSGTLDKFMGDGALAVFGAPVALDDPADRALSTSKILLNQFQPLCSKYQQKDAAFKDISLGIGISSSEMFIGNLGSNRRFDYTVIGVGVNAAQRLATLSTGGTVLFTDAVLKKLTTEVEITTTEKALLKGFDEEVVVHCTAGLGSV
jgi:adenylate cyclase